MWGFIKRWLPIAVIALAIAIVWLFELHQYLSFSYVADRHNELQTLTQQYYVLAVLAYMVIYAASVAISVPGAALLTILGGYLFGPVLGPVYVVISATLGASVIFWAVKTSLGDILANKARSWAKRLQTGFQANAFYYLLSLRVIPIVPFWVLNIVPALLNVRFQAFFFATLIGITPGSVVYATLGNGLSSLFEKGQKPQMDIILEPQILLPLIGLALLSLLPIFYKRSQQSRGQNDHH